MTKQQKFQTRMAKRLIEIGAKEDTHDPSEPNRKFQIMTKAGQLKLVMHTSDLEPIIEQDYRTWKLVRRRQGHCYSLFSRFEAPDRPKAVGLGIPSNPHSGKWNWFYAPHHDPYEVVEEIIRKIQGVLPDPPVLEAEPISDDALRAAAIRIYRKEGKVEIQEKADVSRGDDPGAFVQAWVWVYDEAVTDAEKA